MNHSKLLLKFFFSGREISQLKGRRAASIRSVVASDHTIDQTINKRQKSHGGITRYSTTTGLVLISQLISVNQDQ